MEQYRIALVGAGNVATHLAVALKNAGHKILAVCARSQTSTQAFSTAIQEDVLEITELSLLPIADVYLIAVSDDAIESIVNAWPEHCKQGLVAHTSGSVPMDCLQGVGQCYGVLYPLQTFSKERAVDFSQIPCFVEGNQPQSEQMLTRMANTISTKVQSLSSEKRAYLHLAAVFACNFTNHLYDLSAQIVERNGIPMTWLKPLLAETLSKAISLTPHLSQTGPAKRGDLTVMRKHLSMLEDFPQMKMLYQQLSHSIYLSYLSNDQL